MNLAKDSKIEAENEQQDGNSVSLIRAVDVGVSNFIVGQQVEARYAGKRRYYPGKIMKVGADGKYDVLYDDGESESKIDASLIRAVEGGSGSPSVPTNEMFAVGQKVEARYKGGGKYYPGKVGEVDATKPESIKYTILYDDGEQEAGVYAKHVRAVESDSSSVAGGFAEGQKVEARYGGKKRFYSGQITKVHGDGTFDILYDDGELELKVEHLLIRAVDGGGNTAVEGSRSSSPAFSEGQKVEARFAGKRRYYPGKIVKIGEGGTYNILYDDGGSESNVEASLIRAAEVESATAVPPPGFVVGQQVEARYAGKRRYYPGKIMKVGADGKYDVLYDDGESESKIDASLIRAVEGGSGSPSVPTNEMFAVGQKVEARYKGGGKYYPGKVGEVDATKPESIKYTILYDDGEQEAGVYAKHVRAVQNSVDGALLGGGGSVNGSISNIESSGDGSDLDRAEKFRFEKVFKQKCDDEHLLDSYGLQTAMEQILKQKNKKKKDWEYHPDFASDVKNSLPSNDISMEAFLGAIADFKRKQTRGENGTGPPTLFSTDSLDFSAFSRDEREDVVEFGTMGQQGRI